MNVCECVYTCMQMSVNLCVCVCVCVVCVWTCKCKYVDAFNTLKICDEIHTQYPFLSNTQATSAKKAPRILRVKAPSACCNEDQAS